MFWERVRRTALYQESAAFRQTLDRAVVYEVTAVHHYFLGHYHLGQQIVIPKEIPTCAPLGPVCWFEWRDDGSVGLGATQYGVLLVVVWEPVDGVSSPEVFDGTRWVLRAHLFVLREGRVKGGDARHFVSVFVRADGSIASISAPELADEDRAASLLGYIAEALLAVSFAHCRNVQLVDAAPSRQVRRAALRTQQPCLVYKTLVIDPAHPVVRHEQRRVQSGEQVPKALHLVRGHFAVYTDEKPLFGRYSGRFFIPMHTRGTLRGGLVVKDYAVLGT
jgi:hypothetical protein